ncbi:COG0535 Predicted Fe-S oxidoreductases [uncultured Caudovirales phage]|uniref:COG0535 Predicted Fe-S oxidoreductases n=1 Tax=uncultured Caudovirales phage TaxID=2100421 RepID=A0A6J5L3D5_9CAUD|nr:COG0535 Predicted Fe-S oxidoreductases [uncultured Caudovirales phage]
MAINESSANFALGLYPRGKDWAEPILNHCDSPWTSLTVDLDGKCFLCKCEHHLPISVGDILDFAQLEDVWTSPIAQDLQQTILDRSYTYCAVQHCGILRTDLKSSRYYININIDESCNLACPTCRKEAIHHSLGPAFEHKSQQVSHFVKLINKFDKPLHLTMSGNGDPLASLIMRPLVLAWEPKPNQHIKLFTNGLLMRKLLPESKILANIKEFQLSIDAGSKDVYEQVRQPGKFDILESNLEWLAENKPAGSYVRLMFCLGVANAGDIVNFANLCNKYGFHGEIIKVEDWGTFDTFADYDIISNPASPMYATAVEQLRVVNKLPYITVSYFLQQLL